MKKISILVIIAVFLLSFLHLPVYFFYNNGYYEADTVNADIEMALEYLNSGKKLDIVHDFHKDDIIALLSEIKSIEYTLVSKKEAYKLLSENDVDKNAKYTSVPTEYAEADETVLLNVQLFKIKDQNYLLCEYGKNAMEAYSLFSFDSTQELEELLDSDILFSDGRLNMKTKFSTEHAVKSTLKNFIPTIILMFILLIPYLTAKDKQNKIYKTMSKIGCIAIPVLVIFIYLKNFIF